MATANQKIPLVINKSPEEIDAVFKRLHQSGLTQDDQDFFVGCVELATWLPEALKENKISIRQLQRLIFGSASSGKKKKKKKSNKSDKNASGHSETNPEKNASVSASDEASTQSSGAGEKNCAINIDQIDSAKKPGHGRYSHEAYPDAIKITVNHTQLKPGDSCILSCGGKLYVFKPGTIIRVAGNSSLATIYHYHIDKLRCALCGVIVPAQPDSPIGDEKYDARFKAMLVTQKYYVGVPFHRQENFQNYLNFRLPSSDQYKLCEDVANSGYPVIGVLEKGLANGDLVYNDDTPAKILSVIKENKRNPEKKRRGMYTSCIVGKMEGHPVALYYTGRRHAGENLERLLQYRDATLPPTKQMCDALSHNLPKSIKTIVCNCLSHGFRKFEELVDFFPEFCLHVMHELGKVYKNDGRTKAMSAQERFRFHRTYSKPVMLSLNKWLKDQLAQKKVEPNSALGKSIRYLLKHWKKLRRFLVVPGCPIDNNIVERALKIPIRVRKGALFYKTEHGAVIGSILTSLIQTAILSKENPIDYLTALQENRSAVFKNPAEWVPWRYKESLAQLRLLKAA